MKNIEYIKNEYINSAILNSKALSEGEYKQANKYAKIIARIHDKISRGEISRDLLLNFLSHENIAVRACAAAEVLRNGYDVKRAYDVLDEISNMKETGVEDGLTINAAKWALEFWEKEQEQKKYKNLVANNKADFTNEQIKQQFIDAAIKNSEASAEGDYRTANRQAKLLRKLMQKIENGTYDKQILIELLDNKNIRVRGLAAIDLLRIGFEVAKAEDTLKQIATLDESSLSVAEKLGVLGAQIQLKNWIESGSVT